MNTDYFKKLLDYDFWANERMLTAMEATPNLAEEAAKKMSHVLKAKALWLSRLMPERVMGIIPDLLTPAAGRKLNQELQWIGGEYLSSLTDDRLSRKIAYKNLKGQAFVTALTDILAQMVNHGTYHRGQVASLIKRSGGNPPETDYIAYARLAD
jgi:uncharacterized damage-inducible protein DinB